MAWVRTLEVVRELDRSVGEEGVEEDVVDDEDEDEDEEEDEEEDEDEDEVVWEDADGSGMLPDEDDTVG